MSNFCHQQQCPCSTHAVSLGQTLEELDFEKGIWSAAQSGDYRQVEKHLDKGTDANVCDSAGYTALHYAARNGHFKVCLILLARGASINVITRSGLATPLHRAATRGHLKIVKLFLDNKANAALVDADGKTAMHRAAESGNVEICNLLKQYAPETLQVRDKRQKLPEDYFN